ncbi:hypothetical protein ACO0LB_20140 [Undibacterium sp. SXout7W]|uniref:hypothetical protein n=1 Tax=Undibacterium sp. SXout7W TaxID=3413049 RepID=UPI003BF3F9F0
MALVSIIEAAKLAKVSRKTIYKHLKEGTLSSSENTQGHKVIDTSELIRVFGKIHLDSPEEVTGGDIEGDKKKQEVTQGDTGKDIETLIENAKLKAENAQLRERLDEAKEDKEKLFAQLSEAQATVKLITHDKDTATEKKGFFARIFGTK